MDKHTLEIAKEISKRIKDDIKILAVLGCTFKQDKEQPKILDISYCQHHLQRVVIPGIQTKLKQKGVGRYSEYELMMSNITFDAFKSSLRAGKGLIGKRSAWIGTGQMLHWQDGSLRTEIDDQYYIPSEEDLTATDWLIYENHS